MIKVSGFFFFYSCKEYEEYLVFHFINLSTLPEKIETRKLSLWICISEGFSILLHLLEQFDLVIDVVLLDACDLSVLLTVLIFFLDEVGGVMASSTILFLFSLLFQPCQYYLV